MDDSPGTGTRLPPHDDSLASTIYDILPSSRAMDPSSADIRASPLPPSLSPAAASKPPKRKGSADADDSPNSPPSISLHRYSTRGYWITQPSKRHRLHAGPQDAKMELHQSTCLNLNNPGSTESDLWILPDFDEWELESEVVQQQVVQTRAPLLERAAKSNRERLRRRLEGDGWDFVGGKYGEEEGVLQEAAAAAAAASQSQSEESVDEEFDVVVLPVVQVSC